MILDGRPHLLLKLQSLEVSGGKVWDIRHVLNTSAGFSAGQPADLPVQTALERTSNWRGQVSLRDAGQAAPRQPTTQPLRFTDDGQEE
jgi:hypothetical protein